MTTIMPASELTRKAIAWICEKQEEGEGQSLARLVDDAAARFNLSPLDVEFLQRFYRENQDCPAR